MSPTKHKINKRKSQPVVYWLNSSKALVVLVLFSVIGISMLRMSSAVTINPYGGIDTCRLENNKTVIYGWAADPNAATLPYPYMNVTLAGTLVAGMTDRAGYRDAQVNAWIDKNRPGDPKPGTYGYRVEFTGLYKGTSYPIQGVATNYGPGAGQYMGVNTTGPADGNPANPYFAGGKVPDACLAVRPAAPPPAPAPAPVPQPAPAPAPAPKPAPVPAPRPVTPPAARPRPAAPVPTPPPPPALSTTTDAVVSSGTLGASFKIAGGNAAKIHIVYGADSSKIDTKSAEAVVSGNEANISLAGLKPLQAYSYQVVRTGADGKSVTTPADTFTTAGIDVTVTFLSGKKPVKGVSSKLSSTTFTGVSDSRGVITFINILPGNYNLSYTYQSKKYTETVKVLSPVVLAEKSASTIAAQNHKVDLAKVIPASEPKSIDMKFVSAGAGLAVLLVLLPLMLVVRRRRNAEGDAGFDDADSMEPPGQDENATTDDIPYAPPSYPPDAPTPPADIPNYDAGDLPQPAPTPAMPPPLPPSQLPPADTSIAPPVPGPEHIGKSLRDMVIEAMAEESSKTPDHAGDDKSDDTTPR